MPRLMAHRELGGGERRRASRQPLRAHRGPGRGIRHRFTTRECCRSNRLRPRSRFPAQAPHRSIPARGGDPQGHVTPSGRQPAVAGCVAASRCSWISLSRVFPMRSNRSSMRSTRSSTRSSNPARRSWVVFELAFRACQCLGHLPLRLGHPRLRRGDGAHCRSDVLEPGVVLAQGHADHAAEYAHRDRGDRDPVARRQALVHPWLHPRLCGVNRLGSLRNCWRAGRFPL